MFGSRKILSEGSNLVDHFNSVLWRANDGLTLGAGLVTLNFKGIRTSIAKKPYIFVFFRGVRTPAPPPPMDPPMVLLGNAQIHQCNCTFPIREQLTSN